MPGGSKFTAFIYNTPQYQLRDYDSYKPHHLYIRKEEIINDSTKVNLFDLVLNPETEDSIYFYVHKYLTDFNINNKEILVNGKVIKKVIQDGACLSVQLEYDKKMMRCEQYNLKGIQKASPEIKQLMNIINSKVPETYRLY
ncbi:MAG: hypothetical protein HC830_00325 [Bacteroidetes bacterium]|nr:hypothetical protein [Bacteroidota bacterium]